ncbi:MAG TPA: hypothetical protein VFZ18_15390 [Longimicrobiaceae bacterium]
MMLSPEELLAGGGLTYEVPVPGDVLRPGNGAAAGGARSTVRLRPLTVSDLQLVTRAARENDSLVGVLMVQRALVEPEMSIPQVAGMHVGLLQFLLGEVNRISAIAVTDAEVAAAAAAPLSRAAFVLAREYGWTPQQVSELTLGQVLLHLEMLSAEPA